jgi:Fe2+ or Zn2+ uptake regulation protein
MHDLGYMFASHVQQFMSEEVYVKTTGRWQEVLEKEYGFKVQDHKLKFFGICKECQ